MGRPSKYKDQDLKWEKFGGGLNTVEDPIAIQDGQVHLGSKNFISRSRSIKWRPSIRGVKSSAVSAAALCKGAFEYVQVDGTSKKLAVYGSVLYEVDVSDGSLTSLYTMGGSSPAYGLSFRDKAWVCNGTEVVKVEDGTAYQVGITPPTGASAAALAGGTLPDGDYQVYIAYAREVGGSLVLYSSGQNLGVVTLGGGDNSIRVTSFAQSADGQVDKRVIFLSDADAGVPYQYYTADNDVTTTHDVTSDANRNSAIIYEAVSANSIRPGAFDNIHYHNNRLLGIIDNAVHYSRNGGTVYDFERFPQLNVNTYPYKINAAFSIGEELYFSCPDANVIIWQPKGDMDQRFYIVDERFAFRYPNTMRSWSTGVIGVTQDGVRIFDGASNRFIDQELSYFIKPEIKEIYNGGAGADHQPCAIVYRRDAPVTRTEYILSFRDTSKGNAGNNVRYALNLSELKLFGGTDMIAPWDYWETGCDFFVRDTSNNLYHFQNAATASTVFTELTTSLEDRYVYPASGAFMSDLTVPMHIIKTKQSIPNIKGRTVINDDGQSYILIQNQKAATLRVVLRDETNAQDAQTFSGGQDVALFGVAVFGVSTFSGESPFVQRVKFDHAKLFGRVIHIEIEQNENDPNFESYLVVIETTNEQDNYT